MPHLARLRKVGGSVMLAIPPSLLDALGLKADNSVDLSVKAGKLLVEPKAPRHYTLDELLAQCSPEPDDTQQENEWLDAPAMGAEII